MNSEATNTGTAKPKVDVAAETFVCPNCGGTMRFDIKTQKFMCGACRTESEPDTGGGKAVEYDFSDYLKREALSTPFVGMAVAHCQNCGTEITFDGTQIAAVCPYCDSSQVVTVKQKSGVPPDGVVPFKVDKAEAQELFKKWVRKRWFAPNDFKKRYGEGSLTGMYLPFWTYDAKVYSRYTGQGGKTRISTDSEGKRKTQTTWYNVSGAVENHFDDVQVCATDKVDNVSKVLPYGTTVSTLPFAPEYLSGFYAEVYKIRADAGFVTARSIMNREMESLARQEILRRYDEARVTSLQSSFRDVKVKHVLLPLWSSVFGYRGKTYKYVVNGETGKVFGERPYSVVKITLAVLAALALILALVYLDGASGSGALSVHEQYATELSADDAACYEHIEAEAERL